MTSKTPDVDPLTALRDKLDRSKKVKGSNFTMNLPSETMEYLLNRLAEAESLTKVQSCKYTHEDPYDFDYCYTHDRTFARNGECDNKGLSLVDYLDDTMMKQRGRAVKAEMALESSQLLIQDINKTLEALQIPKEEVNFEETVNRIREQVNLYYEYSIKPII